MPEHLDIVTGGAGFIGSHLVRHLLDAGGRVRVIDDFSTGRRENLAGLDEQYPGRLDVIEHDIREAAGLADAFAGARHVYHQAAVSSVPRSVKDPVASITANVEGTLNVLLAARDAGVAKLVAASSSSVYGDTDELPKHEQMPHRPLSPYAVSKCASEMLTSIFPRVYGVPTVGLRYFNRFGPRQDPNSQYAAVIPRFITRLLAGEAPIVFGDGEQTRDFTYIDNAVQANLLAARCDAEGVAVNVGCGGRHSLNDLVRHLNDILGTSIDPVYEPARVGDVRDSEADISSARRHIGYEPEVDFLEGLRRTAAWYVEETSKRRNAETSKCQAKC